MHPQRGREIRERWERADRKREEEIEERTRGQARGSGSVWEGGRGCECGTRKMRKCPICWKLMYVHEMHDDAYKRGEGEEGRDRRTSGPGSALGKRRRNTM